VAGIRWPLVARRTHKWLALFVGLQVVLWTVSGFYMVAVHIDTIHGDDLIRTAAPARIDPAGLVPPGRIVAAFPAAQEVRLQQLEGAPVWRVREKGGTRLVDARTGAVMAPLPEAAIRRIARGIFTGDGAIVSARLLTVAPLEMQSKKPPFWQVEFAGWNRPTLYLSPITGELISRRHLLWRIFDFAWMLHIMDYDMRSDVNNPLLRVATWSAVAMAVSGAWLLIWAFPRKRKKKTA